MHFVLSEVRALLACTQSVSKLVQALGEPETSAREIHVTQAVPVVGLCDALTLLIPREHAYERELLKLPFLFAQEAQFLVQPWNHG